jgi:hypothetical protein
MKKVIIMVITLVLILALSACGGGDDAEGDTSEATAPAGDTGTSSTPESTPDDTSADDTYASVEWPDNEWTQRVPKPPFTVSSFESDDSGSFIIYFSDATYETTKDYVDTLKANGFKVDPTAMTLDDGKTIGWVGYDTEGGSNDYGGYDEWLVIITSESNGIMEIIKPD